MSDKPSGGAIAVIVSAGSGTRMPEESKKKNFLTLNGTPVLARTIMPFEASSLVASIVIVVATDDIELCRKEIVEKFDMKKVAGVVAGGKERQDSVAEGLAFIEAELLGEGKDPTVAIHDGARCLVTTDIVDRVIKGAKSSGAAVACVPVKDTIKESSKDGLSVVRTLDRARLRSVQTPQTFSFSLLKRAMEKAKLEGFQGTDSSSLIERIGEKVLIVESSYENIKITTEEDLHLAEKLLGARENK
jgi:2-C-methyl-D-erythritol 4-phosphate cytidylyltransferase